MTESLKFFKIDETSVYHDGYIYSFYRDLDLTKPSADPQLQASYHCSLKDQKNCHGRVHTTANWETDKRGQKFQLGIIKNGNHSHEPEQRDTTRRFKFYKNDESSVVRNGYTYVFHREFDIPKPLGDFECSVSYHCQTNANNPESCRARIYTTGQGEIDKQGKEYQWGTFKNCEHSHEIQQVSAITQEVLTKANVKSNLYSHSSSKSGNLKRHMQRHAGQKSYTCDQCSYVATISGNLKRHMLTHSGEKPYKCELCSYAGTTSYHLKIHSRTHTGEKPYKCNLCSYTSTTSDLLKQHMRTHTGEKPYKCQQCSFASRTSGDFKKHSRTHTGEKPYKCTQCFYAGTVSSHLKWHMCTKHR